MLRALLFLFCLTFAVLLTVEACSGGSGGFGGKLREVIGAGGNGGNGCISIVLQIKHSYTFVSLSIYQLTYLNALNVFATCFYICKDCRDHMVCNDEVGRKLFQVYGSLKIVCSKPSVKDLCPVLCSECK